MNEHWASVIDSIASVTAALIWPTILVVFALVFRKHFVQLLEAIRDRIEAGADFHVGSHGLSVGRPPNLDDAATPAAVAQLDVNAAGRDEKQEADSENRPVLTPEFHLTHGSKLKHIKNGKAYYSVRVSLESKDDTVLGDVEKVIYYLHPSFRNREKVVTESWRDFQLRFSAWGEFTIEADVFLKTQTTPIRISRYLNL